MSMFKRGKMALESQFLVRNRYLGPGLKSIWVFKLLLDGSCFIVVISGPPELASRSRWR